MSTSPPPRAHGPASQERGWQWACLACNSTWSNAVTHVCNDAQSNRVEFWVAMLRWALSGHTDEQLRAIAQRPVKREQLVAWLGPSWASDEPSSMPMHNPSYLSDTPSAHGHQPFDNTITKKPTPALHGRADVQARSVAASSRKEESMSDPKQDPKLAGVMRDAIGVPHSAYVVEVKPPAYDVWLPQTINVDGEQRYATVRGFAREPVLKKLETVYGDGNVRFVPTEGYKPDERAEQVRAQIQAQTVHIDPGQRLDGSGDLREAKLAGAYLTLWVSLEGLGEIPFTMITSPDGVGVFTNKPDGSVDMTQPLLQCEYSAPEIGPVKNGVQSIFAFLLAHMPEMLARYQQFIGGHEPVKAS